MTEFEETGAKRRKGWMGLLAVVGVAGLAIVGFATFAGADDTGDGTTTTGPRPHPALTDEQRQCLVDHGLTPPARPADGSRPAPPTDEQRAAFRAAAEACGLPAPANGPGGPAGPGGPRPHTALTDEQRQCLADHGLTPPARPADGSRPAPPTDEQRAAFRAAAEACGLPAPPARGPAGPAGGGQTV